MKILFSNPAWWEKSCNSEGKEIWLAGVRAGSRWPHNNEWKLRQGIFRKGEYMPYPFFMGAAAANLQRLLPDSHVIFRDSIARRETDDSYFDFIKTSCFDYIFIETSMPSFESDRRMIMKLNELSPRSKLILTGPLLAEKAEELIAELPLHACIKGEYDKNSLAAIEKGGIIDFDFMTEDELNKAPFPMFDRDCALNYWDGRPLGQTYPQLQLLSARGCPHKCIFCAWPATMTSHDPDGTRRRTVRFYHAGYLEEFIGKMISDFGFKCVYFDDDTFNLGDRHVYEVCSVMRRLSVPWSAMCRADSCSHEAWREMASSGCFGVKLGFESGSQSVIDNIIHKSLDLKKAAETVKFLKSLGLSLHGTFSAGFPGETKEQQSETQAYIESLALASCQFSKIEQQGGTPLDAILKSGGSIQR